MRLVAVLMFVVAMMVFSIFLVLAAPLSNRVLATPELAGLMERPPATGLLYYFSRGAVRYLWLYFLILTAICIAVVVGVVKNKISDRLIWVFVGVAILLNVLAIASIQVVADYSMPRF